MIQLFKPGTEIVTKDRVAAPGLTSWLQLLLARVTERLQPTEVKTSDYTARAWDMVKADPSGGGFTIMLPPRCKSGDQVAYKNTTSSTNTVTFDPAEGDTVEEASSVTNTDVHGSEWFIYDANARDWSAM